MLGRSIRDPRHSEGLIEAMPGLGLLPVETELLPEKVTRQVSFCLAGDAAGAPLKGYEIHMGRTTAAEGENPSPLNILQDGSPDGCIADDKCMGTYIHGILDNEAFMERLLAPHADKINADAPAEDYSAYRERQFDLLADHFRKYVDVELLYKILGR